MKFQGISKEFKFSSNVVKTGTSLAFKKGANKTISFLIILFQNILISLVYS